MTTPGDTGKGARLGAVFDVAGQGSELGKPSLVGTIKLRNRPNRELQPGGVVSVTSGHATRRPIVLVIVLFGTCTACSDGVITWMS